MGINILKQSNTSRRKSRVNSCVLILMFSIIHKHWIFPWLNADSWELGQFCVKLRLFLRLSWASLVVQLVKNLPAMQETWALSLGWEDPLEKGKAPHASMLAWKIPWTVYHGVAKSQTRL